MKIRLSIEAIIGAMIGIAIMNVLIIPIFYPKQPQIEIYKTDTLLVRKSFVPYQVISIDSGRTLFSGDSIAHFESIDTVDMRWIPPIQAYNAVHGGSWHQILDTLYIPRIYITHDGKKFRVRADPYDQIEVIL
jgi:hypothetical protein